MRIFIPGTKGWDMKRVCPSEVFPFLQKKTHIDTHVIISAYKHSERQFYLVRMGIREPFFSQAIWALADNMNQLSQLQKAMKLANDHGLVVGLFISVSSTCHGFCFCPGGSVSCCSDCSRDVGASSDVLYQPHYDA